MRLRRIAAIATIALLSTVPAHADTPSPTLTMDGPLGTTQISEDRLRELMSEAEGVPREQADAFLLKLSRAEQVALNYAVYPQQITGFNSTGPTDAVMGPCGATVEDCDPPKPRQPQYATRKPVPDPPQPPQPSPPPEYCNDEQAKLTAETALFSTVAYEFTQYLHWCYDKTNVTKVYQYALYDVKWPVFWSCHYSEVPPFPRYDQIPPVLPASSVTASAVGHCTYTAQIKVEVLGRTFEVSLPPTHDYPSITQKMRYDGGCATLMR